MVKTALNTNVRGVWQWFSFTFFSLLSESFSGLFLMLSVFASRKNAQSFSRGRTARIVAISYPGMN
jgi:hypothetical protein